MPPQVVQYSLGHSDIRVTMKHYVFLSTADARAALKHATPSPSPRAFTKESRDTAEGFPWNNLEQLTQHTRMRHGATTRYARSASKLRVVGPAGLEPATKRL